MTAGAPLLYLTSGFPPTQVGGIETHTLELARELRRRGVGVDVYTRGERDDLDEYAMYPDAHDGFDVTRVVFRWGRARTVRHLMHDAELGGAFRRVVEARRPRLVHVHHLAGLGSDCLDVLRELGIPSVMTLHDYYMQCPRGQMFHAELYSCDAATPEHCTPCIAATFPHLMPSGGGAPFAAELPADADLPSVAALHDWLRALLAKPDLLLVTSRAVFDRFVDFGVPPERIRIEPYGQNAAPFAGIRRRPSERLRVGFFGTLIPSKGTHVLVEAFARLAPGTATLTIAGNSPPFYQCTDYPETIRKLVAKVPPENPVEIRGPYEHSELPSMFEEIDVLVVPPLWAEAYGLTLREAFMARCAVIASATGGLTPDVRDGENGFLFPPGDAGALAALLQRLVDEPGLAQRLGAYETPVRTIEDMIGSLLELYRSCGAELP